MPEVHRTAAALFRQAERLNKLFDFGAVYSAKFKSEGAEWFQSELQVLSEELRVLRANFTLNVNDFTQ